MIHDIELALCCLALWCAVSVAVAMTWALLATAAKAGRDE